MVKEDCLLEGKTLSGEAESPLGDTSALVICELAKLLFSWLAIGEAVAILQIVSLFQRWGEVTDS